MTEHEFELKQEQYHVYKECKNCGLILEISRLSGAFVQTTDYLNSQKYLKCPVRDNLSMRLET